MSLPTILKMKTYFEKKIRERFKNDEPFLFGCDSATIIQHYTNLLKQEFPQYPEDKFLVIYKNKPLKITNATEQFKNKFVFYSPSIVYGIDFVPEKEQDVFIYFNGKTISPQQSFQQATRCRKINKLYIYGAERNYSTRFKTIEEVEEHFTELIKT